MFWLFEEAFAPEPAKEKRKMHFFKGRMETQSAVVQNRQESGRKYYAHLFAHLFAPLTHSYARGKVNDLMSQNDLVLRHIAKGSRKSRLREPKRKKRTKTTE